MRWESGIGACDKGVGQCKNTNALIPKLELQKKDQD